MTSHDSATHPTGLGQAVAAGGLLRAGRPVVVMLSGGRDSVCLLHLAATITGTAHTSALHVNYGMRASAADDERLCRILCDSLEVPLTVHRPDARTGGNLQAWAREERYREARRLAAGRDADVAVGHTASDQVETILYRLAAAPGRRALLGMEPRSGRLVRPLLAVRRADTGAYCRELGLAFADDPSNAAPLYARNRIRHGLLPALGEIHPGAEDNVLATAALLRDEDRVLVEVVSRAREALGESPDVAELAGMDPALARLVLQAMGDEAAGGTAPPLRGHLPGILALGADGGTATVDLPGGLRAEVSYGRLRLRRPGDDPGCADSASLPVPGTAEFAGGNLRSERGSFPVADGSVCARSLAPVLEVRAWKPGDAMRPLGLGGSKSLQDLFTDRKVPRPRRHRLPVVVSHGEIAWIPGVATGERFRVNEHDGEHVRLSWSAPVYD